METQYYTLIEKQDFYEIIENKYGELAIFIDAREGTPENPVLEFDGKQSALLKRDARLAVKLDNINEDTVEPLVKEKWLIVFMPFPLIMLKKLPLKVGRHVPMSWLKLKLRKNFLPVLVPFVLGLAEHLNTNRKKNDWVSFSYTRKSC